MGPVGVYLVNQNSGQVFPLATEHPNIVGRGLVPQENPEATIVLPHPQVSKKHARVYLDSSTQCWYLEDCSRHGTMVNGRPTHAGKGGMSEPVKLQHGDYINIAGYILVFYERFMADATGEVAIKPSAAADDEKSPEPEQLPMLVEGMISIIMLAVIVVWLLVLCYWFLGFKK